MIKVSKYFTSGFKLTRSIYLLVICICFSISSNADENIVSVNSITKYAGDHVWEWTAFIDGPSQILNKINCVVYHLQDRPDENICQRGDPTRSFALSQTTSGEFTLLVDIRYSDGATESLKYPLKLDAPPRAAIPVSLRNVAEEDGPKRWRWIAYIDAKPEVVATVRCVEYTLHPTFPDPHQVICHTSDPKYPFGLDATGWGTFELKARVVFDDGSTKDLVHMLDFSIHRR